MPELKIIRMGHPTLRKIARELTVEEIKSDDIKKLIKNMYITMKATHGIGLAAPQVDELIQLAIIEYDEDNPRYQEKGSAPFQVFINPKLTTLDENVQGFWEGCLSVPGLSGYVERPRKIQVDYLDENGEAQIIVAEDFEATVVQHELDHLVGKLYVDRMKDFTQFSYNEEHEEFIAESDED